MSDLCGPMMGMGGCSCAGFSCGFFNSSIGIILVIFILLVIISRSCSWGAGF